MRRLTWAALSLFAILLLGSAVRVTPQESKDNLKKLKEEIGLLGSVINESLAQNFGGPFGILDKARGAYLPGYGVVFSFEVTLTPMQFASPFAPPLTPERERALRAEETRRREQARAVADRALVDFGHALSQLAPNESLAIIIHTISVRERGLERATIVVHAGKQLMDDYHAKVIDRTTFVRKLGVTEY